jgi:hypothetical protein
MNAVPWAVNRLTLTAEARVHPRVSQYGICGGQIFIVICSSPSSLVFPVDIIPTWLFILICHLGDEQ